MARIADQELDHLKQSIAVQRLVEARGIVLKRHGADLIGLCPFHDDHEPSLVISPDKNLWHCLGACQCGGTVIDWVMKSEGVSFRHAVELLRTDPSLAASSSAPVKRSTVTRLPAPIEVEADDQVLLKQVVHYYHRALLQNTEALAYLEKRGIASREAIELLELGFADRSIGYHLPHKNRIDGAAMRGRLQRIGILRASGHEHFNGSLVIPVINDDHVTEIYGRKIRDNLRAGTPSHLYLPRSPRGRGVWNIDALFASREIILCECLIDALTFWCAGFRNVTASYGVGSFTPDHLRAFKEYETERVLIAYDRDAAGDSAAQALAKTLMAEGIDCYRIQFPKGMDANEYAVRVTPATKSLGIAIRKAVWLGKGKAPALTTAAVTTTLDVNEPAAVDYANAPHGPQPRTDVRAETHVRDAAHAPSSLAADSATPEPALFVLPASVLPQALAEDMPTEVSNGEVLITLGDRRYRVRGLNKNLALDVVLKVNVMISCNDAFHVDTFDLYAPRAKHAFIVQAAVELAVKEDVIRHDLGRVLRKLESLQEQNVQQTLTPKQDATTTLNESERSDALALLKEPKLLERILADFARCGVVGEESNKLIGYLAATSRKLESPLAIMVQSSSAAGKSSL
ncbi:MAG: CHC2 zinc finger domain-containing protein, partial [Sulfuricaulis sp.]